MTAAHTHIVCRVVARPSAGETHSAYVSELCGGVMQSHHQLVWQLQEPYSQ